LFTRLARFIIGPTCIAAMLGVASPACAGNFTMQPMILKLAAAQRDGTLELTNHGGERAVFQVEARAWTQELRGDVYGATEEMLLSPPIFTIDAGGTQLIRLAIRRFTMSDTERAYRFYVRQVAGAPNAQLSVLSAFTVPVFVAPIGPARPVLAATIRTRGAGKVAVTLRNSGNVHIKLFSVAIMNSVQGKPLAELTDATYILAGKDRMLEFTLPSASVSPNGVTIRVQDDGGRTQTLQPSTE
jgi:fimbrial chaperone protein